MQQALITLGDLGQMRASPCLLQCLASHYRLHPQARCPGGNSASGKGLAARRTPAPLTPAPDQEAAPLISSLLCAHLAALTTSRGHRAPAVMVPEGG